LKSLPSPASEHFVPAGLRGHHAAHIAAMQGRGQIPAHARFQRSPKGLPSFRLEPVHEIDRSSLFVNVGERDNITGSAASPGLIREDQTYTVKSPEKCAGAAGGSPRHKISRHSTWTKACWIRSKAIGHLPPI